MDATCRGKESSRKTGYLTITVFPFWTQRKRGIAYRFVTLSHVKGEMLGRELTVEGRNYDWQQLSSSHGNDFGTKFGRFANFPNLVPKSLP